jgi:hypothetical protein
VSHARDPQPQEPLGSERGGAAHRSAHPGSRLQLVDDVEYETLGAAIGDFIAESGA